LYAWDVQNVKRVWIAWMHALPNIITICEFESTIRELKTIGRPI